MSKSERTRKLIIEKAAPIFNMRGYLGTSLSDITQALGMTKGAIYGNFSDKDEIALAALTYNFNQIRDAINQKVKKCPTAKEKLTAFAEFYVENFNIIAQKGGCPVLNSAVDADDTHPVLKKRVQSFINYWKENLIKIIRKGQTDGEISKDADADRFSTLFIAIIEGGILMSKTTGDKKHIRLAVDHIKQLIRDL
ncbi:MAG: TetR/AcrR family transcriptional regulator [Spirochaetes bacterium]|nr:TetR/AcrR family transcriptional regulator [Spirochaetota bacterium]